MSRLSFFSRGLPPGAPDWLGRRAPPLPPVSDPRVLATPREGPWGALGGPEEQGRTWPAWVGAALLVALLAAFLWSAWAPVLLPKTGLS